MFDRLLTPKFFHLLDDKQLHESKEENLVSFMLPETADTLEAFLQTKNGAAFVSGVKSLVDQLKQWCVEQKFNTEPLNQFYEHHFFNYESGTSRIVFTLFTEGVRQLTKIVKLLKSEYLSLELKCEAIQHLLSGINVCGPGTFTNIQDAYLCFSNNITEELLSYKKSIAQQTVLNLLNEQQYRLYISPGNEIHYVNAVLETFQTELGIPKTQDAFIKICNQQIVAELCVEFKKQIPKHLTAEAIIDLIISSKMTIYINALNKKMRGSTDYYHDMSSFQNVLDQYGKDPGFNLCQVFDSETLETRSDVEYNLFITLLKRLENSGYFNLKENVIKNKWDNGKLFFNSDYSLRLAFYEKKDERVSLLLYCNHIEKFISVLRMLSDADQCKLVKMLGQNYLQKIIVNDADLAKVLENYSQASVDFCITFLNELGSAHLRKVLKIDFHNFYFFRKIMQALPDCLKLSFLRNPLGIEFFKEKLDRVDTLDSILKTLPVAVYESFLRDAIGEDTLKKIINEGWFLCRIPASTHKVIIPLLGMDHFGKILEQVWELKIVIDNLPIQNRIEFIYKLGITHLRGLLKTSSDREWLLARLPKAHQEPLKKQLEFFKISSMQEYKGPALSPSSMVVHIADGLSIYDPKELDNERIIGLLRSEAFFPRLCIYNKLSRKIEIAYDNLRIRQLLKINENQFALSFVNSATIMLIEWKDNQLIKISETKVNLNTEKVEEIISIIPFKHNQLLVSTAEYMNIINNYKTWHLQLCDLMTSTCTHMLTVHKDEHCFIRELILLSDGRAIAGWNPFSDMGEQNICFIDTNDFSVQTIPIDCYAGRRIKCLTPIDNGDLVMTLDNNDQVAIEFEHTRVIKQLPGVSAQHFLTMHSIFCNTSLTPASVSLVAEYTGISIC